MSKLNLPCINCVCLPMCKHKQVKEIFAQCSLIDEFWENSIDTSFNQTVAADVMELSSIFNETLNRYFVPCFTGEDLNITKTIGIADIDSMYNAGQNNDRIRATYRIFRDTFEIDMLEVSRVKAYLHPIVKEIVDD